MRGANPRKRREVVETALDVLAPSGGHFGRSRCIAEAGELAGQLDDRLAIGAQGPRRLALSSQGSREALVERFEFQG